MNQVNNQQVNHKTITGMQTSGTCCYPWIMQTPPGPISGVHHHFKCDFSGFHQPDFDKGWRDNVVLHRVHCDSALWGFQYSHCSFSTAGSLWVLCYLTPGLPSLWVSTVFHFLPAAIYPQHSIVCCIYCMFCHATLICIPIASSQQ